MSVLKKDKHQQTTPNLLPDQHHLLVHVHKGMSQNTVGAKSQHHLPGMLHYVSGSTNQIVDYHFVPVEPFQDALAIGGLRLVRCLCK